MTLTGWILRGLTALSTSVSYGKSLAIGNARAKWPEFPQKERFLVGKNCSSKSQIASDVPSQVEVIAMWHCMVLSPESQFLRSVMAIATAKRRNHEISVHFAPLLDRPGPLEQGRLNYRDQAPTNANLASAWHDTWSDNVSFCSLWLTHLAG